MLPDQDKLLSQLYQDHFAKLTMYALAVLKNESRAQDAVQDTFHEAITHIDILIQHPQSIGLAHGYAEKQNQGVPARNTKIYAALPLAE